MAQELIELFRSVLKEELQPVHERLGRLEEGQQRLEENQLRLEERQQRLEERQQRLEERQQRLEERQQRLEEQQQRLEERQQRLEEQQQRLEERQQRWEEKLDNFLIETRSHFKKIEEELAEHRRMFELLSNDWRNAKIDIDYLSAKTGKHDAEIHQIKKRLELQQL
jgi:chromosome segregation ATPase